MDTLASGTASVGWEEVDDLSGISDKPRLKQLLTDTYPDASPLVIGNWAGQLWRFKEEIAIGDLVVMPLPDRRLAIGRVTGHYRYQRDAEPAMRHQREVAWERTDLRRDKVQPDLRDSMGSLLTVFELSRNEAPHRIAVLMKDGTDPGASKVEGAPSAISSPKLLEERVRAALADGETLQITVRELLAIWGHTHRWPTVVAAVNTGLDELGLVTRPPYETENINSVIDVVPVGVEPRGRESILTAAELPAQIAEDDRPVTLLVKQLPSAKTKILSVAPDDELHTATTLMGLNNFSQLPVLDANGWLCGVVTWESVGMAYISHAAPTLGKATVQALEADGEDNLLDWIGAVYQRGFVFVRDADHHVVGIITSADLTSQLGNQIQPFLLVAEIERRLRRIANRALNQGWTTLEEIRKLTQGRTKDAKSAKDFTLGNYPYIFKSDSLWDGLQWKMDRDLLRARLTDTANFRNALMHLNLDDDASDEAGLAPLRGLLAMLKSLDYGS